MTKGLRYLRLRSIIPLTLAAIILLLSMSMACGSDSSSEPTPTALSAPRIGDISEILERDPEVVEIRPRSAVVLAITDVDVVCGVSYGPTTDYGMIATDQDMVGGGHRDHHPLLTGLEPDTEYHFTVGGVGPDGTVYRGRDFTFRTPPADAASEASGQNLALTSSGAAIGGVISNFGGGPVDGAWGANNAIDGDPGTPMVVQR